MSNVHEDRARAAKVAAVADLLQPQFGDSPELVLHLTDEEWDRVAELAGQRPLSKTSREMVPGALAAVHRARTMRVDDIFANL